MMHEQPTSPFPVTLAATCDSRTVTVASGQFAAMVPGKQYRLASSTNCWFKFGANPTAVAAADDNHFLGAGDFCLVAASGANTVIAIIRDTADGNASLSLVQSAT
jgi:hypothetical protein